MVFGCEQKSHYQRSRPFPFGGMDRADSLHTRMSGAIDWWSPGELNSCMAALPSGSQPTLTRSLKSRVAAGEASLSSSSSFTRCVPDGAVQPCPYAMIAMDCSLGGRFAMKPTSVPFFEVAGALNQVVQCADLDVLVSRRPQRVGLVDERALHHPIASLLLGVALHRARQSTACSQWASQRLSSHCRSAPSSEAPSPAPAAPCGRCLPRGTRRAFARRPTSCAACRRRRYGRWCLSPREEQGRRGRCIRPFARGRQDGSRGIPLSYSITSYICCAVSPSSSPIGAKEPARNKRLSCRDGEIRRFRRACASIQFCSKMKKNPLESDFELGLY